MTKSKTARAAQSAPTQAAINRANEEWQKLVESLTPAERKRAVALGYCAMFADRSGPSLTEYIDQAGRAQHVPALLAALGMMANHYAVRVVIAERGVRS